MEVGRGPTSGTFTPSMVIVPCGAYQEGDADTLDGPLKIHSPRRIQVAVMIEKARNLVGPIVSLLGGLEFSMTANRKDWHVQPMRTRNNIII